MPAYLHDAVFLQSVSGAKARPRLRRQKGEEAVSRHEPGRVHTQGKRS
jgi:hypothetical protein